MPGAVDPVVILPPIAPLIVVTPVRTVPLVVGPAVTGGAGSPGEVTYWVTGTQTGGDPTFLWDATNQSLSVTTANVNGGIVSTNTVADGGIAIIGTADNVDGTGVQGNSAEGWGVQGTTGDGTGVFGLATAANGWGVQGTATGSDGIAVRAETGHTAAVGVQVKQPNGATANSAEGYVNFVLKWAIDVTGAFLGIVRLGWRVGGTLIGTRAHLNLIAGTGITLTPVDQSGTDAVDVTIAATTPIPLTTKGDVLGYDTAVNRIPVGTNGQVLTANSGAALGVDWETPSVFTPDFGSDGNLLFFTTYPAVGGDGNLGWDNTAKSLFVTGDGDVLPVLTPQANAANGIAARIAVAQVDGHPLQLMAPTSFTGNFLEWFVNAVSQGAFPAAGGAYFNGAALSTSATDGFLYLPGGAGPPTGTPVAHTGTVPCYVDETNHKLYLYLGGAWLATAALT